jgi:predicted RecB family nuclease
MALWAEHPHMHVYRFKSYEPSALKRLTGRQATREDEIDRVRFHLRGLLRATTRTPSICTGPIRPEGTIWASNGLYVLK